MIGTPSPKLILATDLDGTFLHPHSQHQGTRLYRLLREHRADIQLIFATGRGYESIVTLLDDPAIPVPDYIIADVGATILRRQSDGFTPVLPLQDEIAARWPGRDFVLAKARQIQGLQFQEVPQEYRCSFLFEHESAREQACALARSLGLDFLVSAGRYLDILPANVSKGASLQHLMALEKLPENKVLVAGDTLNDLSLMRTGLRGVVVGNAENALRQAVIEDQTQGKGNRVYLARGEGPLGILEAMRHHGLYRELGLMPGQTSAQTGHAELVMVYHRQPFDEVSTPQGTERQLPKSPNGIIPTLLGCFADGRKGAWVAWSLQESRTPAQFEQDVPVNLTLYPRLHACRVALTQEDVDIFYKQFS